MPLLAITVGVRTATPLVGLVVLTNVAILLARTRRSVDLQVAWRLLLSSAVGIPAAALICAGHGLGGLWTGSVLGLYLAAFPFVLLAIFLDHRLGGHIPADSFQHVLFGALIVLGLLLFW